MWTALLGLALATEPIDAEDLSWLSGTWASTARGRRVEEVWTAPDGGTLFGINRTTRAGTTTFHEYLRIEEKDKGLAYVALPRDAPEETSFAIADHGPQWVHFVNPAHDFPTSIYYKRTDDKLQVRVRGADGKGFELNLTRVNRID